MSHAQARDNSSEELFLNRVHAMEAAQEYQEHLHGVVMYDDVLSE